ncbi:Deleted in malignant brain tumors 1 protein [Holothuria leucospilota]|uniref:Deleted in malignant brain tumors 1 protein n=1 Tax=Holothuria leucospilota TaxID=206669 RepID=A0A9Q1BZQ4_HOLLE|nr:Deleted in malignant brain tumors 1 protein [Holothuria leucospilota]
MLPFATCCIAVLAVLLLGNAAGEEPVCYSREQIDDRQLVVRRIPCGEEEKHPVYKTFPSEGSVDILDLMEITCSFEELPEVLNGKFKSNDCTGRRVKDSCTFVCDDGYYPSSRVLQTTCQEEGGDVAGWSKGFYSCHAPTCSFSDLPNVTNGFFDISACSGNSEKDVCNVTCTEHYYPSSPYHTICEHIGTSTGQWTQGNFSCEKKSCLDPSLWRGSVYTWINTTMTWNEADIYCRSISAHLVYINDAEENSFVKNLTNCNGKSLEPGTYASIGLQHAAVSLDGDIRLVDGTNNCEGGVEMWYNGQWGTLCGDSWNMANARVICRQLGRGPPVSANTEDQFEGGTAHIVLYDVSCQGDEERLPNCPGGGFVSHDCGGGKYAVVNCTCEAVNRNIRLADGNDDSEGRVEVFYNGQWGTVCDDYWTMANAHVVCRQLERGSAITTYKRSYFGQGTGDIVLDDVVCQGHEQRLIDCQSIQGRDQHDCTHSEDVGVKCAHASREIHGTFIPYNAMLLQPYSYLQSYFCTFQETKRGNAWRWQDSSVARYTNWESTQLENSPMESDNQAFLSSWIPSQFDDPEGCVGIDSNGLWYIYHCESLNTFICEK